MNIQSGHPYSMKKSCHGMDSIEVVGIDAEILRSIIINNWSDSLDYRMHVSVNAFLQSYAKGQWAMSEFWCGTDEEKQAFVNYVNDEIAKVHQGQRDAWERRQIGPEYDKLARGS